MLGPLSARYHNEVIDLFFDYVGLLPKDLQFFHQMAKANSYTGKEEIRRRCDAAIAIMWRDGCPFLSAMRLCTKTITRIGVVESFL